MYVFIPECKRAKEIDGGTTSSRAVEINDKISVKRWCCSLSNEKNIVSVITKSVMSNQSEVKTLITQKG